MAGGNVQHRTQQSAPETPPALPELRTVPTVQQDASGPTGDAQQGYAATQSAAGYGSGAGVILRQFLNDNFGWDIYDWKDDDIRF